MGPSVSVCASTVVRSIPPDDNDVSLALTKYDLVGGGGVGAGATLAVRKIVSPGLDITTLLSTLAAFFTPSSALSAFSFRLNLRFCEDRVSSHISGQSLSSICFISSK